MKYFNIKRMACSFLLCMSFVMGAGNYAHLAMGSQGTVINYSKNPYVAMQMEQPLNPGAQMIQDQLGHNINPPPPLRVDRDVSSEKKAVGLYEYYTKINNKLVDEFFSKYGSCIDKNIFFGDCFLEYKEKCFNAVHKANGISGSLLAQFEEAIDHNLAFFRELSEGRISEFDIMSPLRLLQAPLTHAVFLFGLNSCVFSLTSKSHSS